MNYVRAFLLLVTLSSSAGFAQVADDVVPAPNAPEFDVVSIRQSAPHVEGWSQEITPDSLIVQGNLKQLIRFAYGTKIDFIRGGARWTNDSRFELYAKVAPEDVATLKGMTRGQRKAMLQGVLAERFGLKTHLEPRTISVYRLKKLVGGPRLKNHRSENDNQENNNLLALAGSITISSHELSGDGITIATLVRTIEPLINATILDDTGLSERYDVHLKWLSDCDLGSFTSAIPERCEAGSTDPFRFISIALQEQLGLQLMPGKGTVEELVIDEAHAPIEN